MMTGTLYLVPNTLGDEVRENQLPHVLPTETIVLAAQLKYWIVENAKTARALLKAVGTIHPLVCPIQEMQMSEWRGKDKKGDRQIDLKELLAPLQAGHDMGLMSEAGLPAIADPGADVVRLAHQLNLPVNATDKAQALKQLEQESKRKRQTQIWIETPYRNGAMVEGMMESLAPSTLACVAADLTLPTQWIKTAAIAQWREMTRQEPQMLARLHQRPAVFLLLA
jgi:16S rRNA (cytidine1402-2'-O)-methyltransferase